MATSWKDDKQNTPTHIFNMHNFGGKILIHTHSIVCDDLYKSPISRSFKANHSALSQQPNTSQRPAATQPPALRTPRAGRRHRRSADPAAAAAASQPPPGRRVAAGGLGAVTVGGGVGAAVYLASAVWRGMGRLGLGSVKRGYPKPLVLVGS